MYLENMQFLDLDNDFRFPAVKTTAARFLYLGCCVFLWWGTFCKSLLPMVNSPRQCLGLEARAEEQWAKWLLHARVGNIFITVVSFVTDIVGTSERAAH